MIFFFFQGSWFRNREVRYLIFLKAVINTIPMIQMGPSTWWDTKCISLFHDCNPCWQPCTSALRLEISTLSSLCFPWKHLRFFFATVEMGWLFQFYSWPSHLSFEEEMLGLGEKGCGMRGIILNIDLAWCFLFMQSLFFIYDKDSQ